MTLEQILESLQRASFATAIAESNWLFPTLETLHVMALALMVGSIGIIDLRLLGRTNRQLAVRELMAAVLPWTWTVFGIALLTGFLMFSAHAVRYAGLLPFRIKLGLIFLAGLNMLLFHLVTMRGVVRWDAGEPPAAVRAAGAASIVLWVGVVTAGRWLGFV